MSISKRFKKKIKNFRQGMTAWRVHSYPICDEGYHNWGRNREELDRKHGKGNSTCFKFGNEWIFIRCERICNVPTKNSWEWLDQFNGKRRVHEFKSLQSMWGSDGGRFFKNQFQARAFMHEIIKGMHPEILNENIYFHNQINLLDEVFLGYDNYYDDHVIYDDWFELEFT